MFALDGRDDPVGLVHRQCQWLLKNDLLSRRGGGFHQVGVQRGLGADHDGIDVWIEQQLAGGIEDTQVILLARHGRARGIVVPRTDDANRVIRHLHPVVAVHAHVTVRQPQHAHPQCTRRRGHDWYHRFMAGLSGPIQSL